MLKNLEKTSKMLKNLEKTSKMSKKGKKVKKKIELRQICPKPGKTIKNAEKPKKP